MQAISSERSPAIGSPGATSTPGQISFRGQTSTPGQTSFPGQTSPLQRNVSLSSPWCNLEVQVFSHAPSVHRPAQMRLCVDQYHKRWYLTLHSDRPFHNHYMVENEISEIHFYKDLLCLVLHSIRITARPLNQQNSEFSREFARILEKLIEINGALKRCEYGGYDWVEGRHWLRRQDATVASKEKTGFEMDNISTDRINDKIKVSVGRRDIPHEKNDTSSVLNNLSMSGSNPSDSSIFASQELSTSGSNESDQRRHSTPDSYKYRSLSSESNFDDSILPLDMNNSSTYSDGHSYQTGGSSILSVRSASGTENGVTFSGTTKRSKNCDRQQESSSFNGILESGLCMIRHCRGRLVSDWQEGWIILGNNTRSSWILTSDPVTPDLFPMTPDYTMPSHRLRLVVACKDREPFRYPLDKINWLLSEPERVCLVVHDRKQVKIQLVPCDRNDATFKPKIDRIVQKIDQIANPGQIREQNPKTGDKLSKKTRVESVSSSQETDRKNKTFLHNDSLAEMAAEFGCARLNETNRSDVSRSRDCENAATLDVNNNSTYSDGRLSQIGDQIPCNISTTDSLSTSNDINHVGNIYDYPVENKNDQYYLDSGLCFIRRCQQQSATYWLEGWIILKPKKFVHPDQKIPTLRDWLIAVTCKGEKLTTFHPVDMITFPVSEPNRACLRIGKRSHFQIVPCYKNDANFKPRIDKMAQKLNEIKTSAGQNCEQNSRVKVNVDDSISSNSKKMLKSSSGQGKKERNSSRGSAKKRKHERHEEAATKKFLHNDSLAEMAREYGCVKLNDSKNSDVIRSRDRKNPDLHNMNNSDQHLSQTSKNIADVRASSHRQKDNSVVKSSRHYFGSGLCMIRRCRPQSTTYWREGWIILSPKKIVKSRTTLTSEDWRLEIRLKDEKPTVQTVDNITCTVSEPDRACLRVGKQSQLQLTPYDKNDANFKPRIDKIVQKLNEIKASSVQSCEQKPKRGDKLSVYRANVNDIAVTNSTINTATVKDASDSVVRSVTEKTEQLEPICSFKKKRKCHSNEVTGAKKKKKKTFLLTEAVCDRTNGVSGSRDCGGRAADTALSSGKTKKTKQKRKASKSRSPKETTKKRKITVTCDVILDEPKPRKRDKKSLMVSKKKDKSKAHSKNEEKNTKWKILPTKRRLMTTRLRNQNSAVRRGMILAGRQLQCSNEEYLRLRQNLANSNSSNEISQNTKNYQSVDSNSGHCSSNRKMDSVSRVRESEKFHSSPPAVVIDLTSSPHHVTENVTVDKGVSVANRRENRKYENNQCEKSFSDGEIDSTDHPSKRIEESESVIQDSMDGSDIYLSDSNSGCCTSDADSGMADSVNVSQMSPGSVTDVKLNMSKRQKLINDFMKEALTVGEKTSIEDVMIVKRKNKVTQTSEDDVIDVTPPSIVTSDQWSDCPQTDDEQDKFFSADDDDVSSVGSGVTSLRIVTSDEDLTSKRHSDTNRDINRILDKILDITTEMEDENTTTQNTIDQIRAKIDSQASTPLLKPGQFPDFFVTPDSSPGLSSLGSSSVPNSPIINRIYPILSSPEIVTESPLPLTPVRVAPGLSQSRLAETPTDSSQDSFPVEVPCDDDMTSNSNFNSNLNQVSSLSNLAPVEEPRFRHESPDSSVCSFIPSPEKDNAQITSTDDGKMDSVFTSQGSQVANNFHHEFERFIHTSGQVSDSNRSQASVVAKPQANYICDCDPEDDLDLKMTSESENEGHSSTKSLSDTPIVEKKQCYVKKASVSVFFIADAKFKFGEIGRKNWIKSALLKQEAMMWLKKQRASKRD